MYFDNPFNIPSDLLNRVNYEDDISILIGENGSGKSSMLNEIAKYFLGRGATKVIAVANTIHDKFTARGDRYEALKASAGKAIVKRTLKSALNMLTDEDNKRFNDISRTLEYVNFDPVIGLRLAGINRQYEGLIEQSSFEPHVKKDMQYFLSRFVEEAKYDNRVLPVNLYQSSFYDIRDSFLIGVLKFEKELKSLKIIRDIEVFLSKDRRFIPANSGSSGELILITSVIYLMITIKTGSVILIDEPENSLHPKWQTEYVKMIADLLYRYQPKIIIATHSALIINSAELTAPWVKIYKGGNGTFTLAKSDVHNVEEAYQDFFDVTTPENRFLSQDVAKKMNQLAAGEITMVEFERMINDFSNNAYDDKQKDVLAGVIEMGRKIIASR